MNHKQGYFATTYNRIKRNVRLSKLPIIARQQVILTRMYPKSMFFEKGESKQFSKLHFNETIEGQRDL